MTDVFAEYREGLPERKGFEGKNYLDVGASGNIFYQGEVLTEKVFLYYVARIRRHLRIYRFTNLQFTDLQIYNFSR